MKRISPGTVTIAVIAVLFGLLTAYAARHYFGSTPQVPKKQTATVVAPKVNLPKYSRIRDEDLETVQVPIQQLPEGAVRLRSRALFRLVKTTIMAGRPILEKDLYAVGEVPLLADQLPPGYKSCGKKKHAQSPAAQQIQPSTTARNVPTLAPPQTTSSLAAGGRFERGPHGQVIHVQVQAEAAGAQRN